MRNCILGNDAVSMMGGAHSKVVRIVTAAITAGYAAFCFLAVLVLSMQDYESWWTGPEVPGPKPDYCYAPDPSDDDSGIMALLTFILIAVLLVPGLISLVRRRRIRLSFVLAVGLILYWIYAFFKQRLFC